MAQKSRIRDGSSQRPQPTTDHTVEGRHQVVQKLAYQYREQRGLPLGSPEADWFAAENDLRSYLNR